MTVQAGLCRTCSVTTLLVFLRGSSYIEYAYLLSSAPPDPPAHVTFRECTSRGAIVSWEPGRDNFSPITEYYIEYNHTYAPSVWKRVATIEDPKLTEAAVTISPYANYTFRVIAKNAMGEGQPSKMSSPCEANPAKPDQHPENVHTDRSKPGVLIIKWKVNCV